MKLPGILVIIAFLLSGRSQAQDNDSAFVESSIENGLITKKQFKDTNIKPFNIEERMKHHKVPSVSFATAVRPQDFKCWVNTTNSYIFEHFTAFLSISCKIEPTTAHQQPVVAHNKTIHIFQTKTRFFSSNKFY